jgi:small subunit ribosomal protein S21
MAAHRFAIGQLVRLRWRPGLSPRTPQIYRITSLMPEKYNLPQYRVRSNEERYERVMTEDDLDENAWSGGVTANGALHRRQKATGLRAHNTGGKMQVLVRDNNVEQALRVLKKKMQREGVFREMRARRAYEKPSEKRVREKSEAVRRARKLARKQAQREGLLPLPKKRVAYARPRPET